MVVFEQIKNESGIIMYYYYSENERDKKPGIIELNTVLETIDVIRPAEKDWLRRIEPSELNSMRDAINAMRVENGEAELTQEECPSATEVEEWYWYADHAVRKIVKAYSEGTRLEHGAAMWY